MANDKFCTRRVTLITLSILVIFAISFIVVFSFSRDNNTCGCSAIPKKQLDSDHEDKNSETLTILTDYGKVRGRKEYTLFGHKPFFAFKGIPYAQPPIGELRFKPPKESNKWFDVHDAFEYGNICVQRGGKGDEDCLFLNIFVPTGGNNKTVADKQFPVLLTIHGGAFAVGSSAETGPDFLIDQDDIILVTINYRLGALGFMSLKTPEYSGNMGLKDQSLAINWIYKNIHHFGGDPNQITLHGLSAGSASIELHLLTKNQLFKRAIMASGSIFNPWTMSYTDHTPILYRLANKYEYRPNNITELIDSLLKMDAHNFIDIQSRSDNDIYSSERITVDFIWVPVIEGENAIDPFLIDSPVNIYRNFTTNIDLFIGTAADEGIFLLDVVLKNPEILVPFNKKFEIDLPLNNLNQQLNFTSPKYQEIANEIRWHYFQNSNGQVSNSSIYGFVHLWSDIMISYGVYHSAKLLSAASTGKTYYYVFSVNSAFNVIKLSTYAHSIGMGGSTHGDDSAYVLGNRTPDGKSDKMYLSVDENSIERQRMNDFTRIYCNFIKHGIPMVDIDSEPKLLPFTATETNYLNITNDGPIIRRDAQFYELHFWNNVLEI